MSEHHHHHDQHNHHDLLKAAFKVNKEGSAQDEIERFRGLDNLFNIHLGVPNFPNKEKLLNAFLGGMERSVKLLEGKGAAEEDILALRERVEELRGGQAGQSE